MRAAAAAVALGVLAALALATQSGGGAKAQNARGAQGRPLIGVPGARPGELRETVPLARRVNGKPRSVLSVALPRVRAGDKLRYAAEVTVTTTCVEPLPRCIGRPYRFDPKLRARVVMAGAKRASTRRDTLAVSDAVALQCEQTRPNRNHHCPLVIDGAFEIEELGQLPCKPRGCRLNMVLSAHHRSARGGEVVAIGADRPDGSVDGGKGRISAAVIRAGADVDARAKRTARRRVKALPASFQGGQRVVYSQRLANLQEGDVLLVAGRMRTAIRDLPYFVAAKLVLATGPRATQPNKLVRRVSSRRGLVTDTNGFNCTPGPSAFSSPCTTRKAGLAVIRRDPPRRDGRRLPLYLNLVARTFPKVAQARGWPPARVKWGGGLVVSRLRAR